MADDYGIWRQHMVGGDGIRQRWWMFDAVAVDNKSINKRKKIKQTHHHIHKLSDCLDVRPDPFAVGLWVNGTGRCTNDRATRALLGVHLHEIKRPEQMPRAPPPWSELVLNNELPKDLNDPHARSEELAEEPCLL